MSFDALPHEVVELIIDSISDSPRDYKSYSLVSRGWSRRCRYHAFGSITLRADNDRPLPKSIARSISPFVRELEVIQPSTDSFTEESEPDWANIALLTHLQRVEVNDGGHFRIQDLFRHLYPAIKGKSPIVTITNTGNMFCTGLYNDIILVLREASELYIPNCYRLFAESDLDRNPAPAQIKHFTLIACTYEDLQLSAKILSVGPSHLQSLAINGMSPLWQEVLHNLGPSLEYFVYLKNYIALLSAQESDGKATVIPDFSANPNLKVIGFEASASWFTVTTPSTQPTYMEFLTKMLTNVSTTLNLTLLIDSNEKLDQLPDFQSTIEQLASARPSVKFKLLNYGVDLGSGAGHSGPPIKPHMRSPDLYLKHWFPELYRTGRMAYRTKYLNEHTFSDLQQYVT